MNQQTLRIVAEFLLETAMDDLKMAHYFESKGDHEVAELYRQQSSRHMATFEEFSRQLVEG